MSELKREDVERLLELEKKATPGPWQYDSYNCLHAGPDKMVMSIPDHPDGESSYEPAQITERSEWYRESEANIRMVEAVRGLLPDLAREWLAMDERIRLAEAILRELKQAGLVAQCTYEQDKPGSGGLSGWWVKERAEAAVRALPLEIEKKEPVK